jgi:hypothetical protein
LAAGPVSYGIGLWAASMIDGRTLGSAVCFDPAAANQLTLPRLMAAVTMAAGAILFLFATPWMLGTLAIRRIPSRRATAGAWSLAANSAALLFVCMVLRGTVEIDRGSFFLGWMAWSGLLLLAAWKPAPAPGEIGTLWRRWGPGVLIGLAAVILATVLFCPQQFVQCFNGDGIETFELARSLRSHLLPYWEIETTGRTGPVRMGTVVVNPSLINSYWTCALQLLLGEAELATRLSFSVWWLGIFAVALCMVRPGDTPTRWLPAIPLAMSVFLATTWYTFYVGYYPHMTDLANPGVPDALFTLLLLLGLDCLRERDLAGWVVLMALASLVLYAGPVLFVLTVAAAVFWRPAPRGTILRAATAGSALLSGLVLFYVVWGWCDGSLWDWPGTISTEYLREYALTQPGGRAGLLFVGYFLLGCGALPAIGLLLAFVGKTPDCDVAWDRTVATVALVYLLIVVGAGHKNLHYLGPLLPIPLILWLRLPRRWAGMASAHTPHRTAAGIAAREWTPAALATAGLAVSLFLSWPASRTVFTRNRELGAITTFQTRSYEEAVRWGRIAGKMYQEGHLGWSVGEHTWVHYSERHPRPVAPRSLLLTGGAAPPGYDPVPVFESKQRGVRLYSRDPEQTRWMASGPSPSGLDRWPRVFRPIAVPARPRHRAER